MPKKPEQTQYKDLLERARKRYRLAVDAERDIRREALIDLDYLAGDQWDQKVKRDREQGPSPRPCLVFNKVLPPVTQLGNQARQNKPAIQVNAVDSKGDPDTAKVMAGMIKHIEYDSDADVAYDTALFYAAGCGFGYWRYGCEYTDNESFDQDLKVLTVEDPFAIYLDCYARKQDRSDMKWAFVIDRMANDVHEARFGKDAEDLTSEFVQELEHDNWRDSDSKQVAEYWEVESTEKTLRMRREQDGTLHKEYLEDMTVEEPGEFEGETVKRPMTPEEIEGIDWELGEDGNPKERTVEIPVVWQYLINGVEVLEEPTKWDGLTIPIVMVTGLEMIIRGVHKIFSMTRFARDPQQLFNFYKTMEAETISLAPKPKYVGAVGQFRTKRRDWARANTDNAAFLEYDPVAVGDKLASEPQWRTFDPPVQALSIGAMAAADDIKSSTGYYDPSLGQAKVDQSGVAIEKLQRQGDVSNYHFMDNQARAMKRGGRICLEVIPRKYDTAREIRIIGEDQKQRIVTVNAPFQDHDGKMYHHKLDIGRYDCRVELGPSYSTQRLETRQMLMALAKGNPEVWQLAADIFFENQDFVGADRLAKRFKKALPPNLQDDDQQADIPPQLQAQMAQMQQQMQGLALQNQQLTDLLKTKVLERESAERIATQNNQAKMYVAEATSKAAAMNQLANTDHQALQAELNRRAGLLRAQMDIEADAAADAAEHLQQQQQMQQQQQASQQQQQADRQHQAGMAQQQAGADQQENEAQRAHELALAQQAAQQAQPPAAPPQKA
jgi:hypothetical protein